MRSSIARAYASPFFACRPSRLPSANGSDATPQISFAMDQVCLIRGATTRANTRVSGLYLRASCERPCSGALSKGWYMGPLADELRGQCQEHSPLGLKGGKAAPAWLH